MASGPKEAAEFKKANSHYSMQDDQDGEIIMHFMKRMAERTWRGQDKEEESKGYIIRVNIHTESTGKAMPVTTILKMSIHPGPP